MNRALLKQVTANESAWDFNTANNAVAAQGTDIYIANLGKRDCREVALNAAVGPTDFIIFSGGTDVTP